MTVLTVGVAPPANAAGTVSLSVSPSFFAANTPTVFTATLDQPLSTFATGGEDLALMLRDETDGSIFVQCGGPDITTCSGERTAAADQPHNIRAYVGERNVDQVVNVKAQSTVAAVGWRPFEVSLSMQRAVNGVNFMAVANQNTMNSGYDLRLYNTTTGEHLTTCSNAVSCGHFIYDSDFNIAHNFIAMVATTDGFAYPPTASIASSTDGPLREFGPSAANVKGGTVECQCTTQKSEADPVNTANGMLWERVTDLAVPGRGPAFAFTRNYSAAMAGENGPLGYGWTHNYAAKTLTDAVSGVVTVVQENGSEVTFTPDNSGGYTGPSNVLAALTPVAGGGTRFTRNSDRTVLTFTSTGRLSTISDRNNETTTLGYNTSGQLVTVTDPAGRVVTLTWTNGRITGLTDVANRTVGYGYNASGDLTTVSDVTSKVTTFGYDVSHRLTSMTDPRGGVVTNTFDSDGRVATQTNALGKTATFAYSVSGDINYTNFTNERGITTRFAYWSGLLVEEKAAFQTVDEATTVYTYDPKTLGLIAVTDPTDRTTTSTYNSQGERTSTTDPLGATTMSTYTPQGDLASSTNALGVTTTLTYNNNGNLTSTSTSLNATVNRTTGYTYGDAAHPGDVTTITDPRGKTTTFTQDAAGNVTAVTDPLGRTVTTAYDNIGRAVSTVSPRGNLPGAAANDFRTTMTYDAFDRPLTVTNPLGQVTSTVYDPNGNPTTVTDPKNRTAATVFDALNRPTQMTHPDQTAVKTGYDEVGNVLTQTDGANKVTTYTYDPLNRPLTVKDPKNRIVTSAYDKAGRLTSRKDALNKTTIYEYDPASRLTRIDYNAIQATTTPNASFSYDPLGRRTSMTDHFGVTNYAYDNLNRLTAVTGGGLGDRKYEHNLNDQVTKITYPNGQAVQRGYDDAGQWTSATDWTGQQFTFGHNADGALTNRSNPNNTAEARAYDNVGQPTSITHTAGTTTFASFGYQYDTAGQVTNWTPTGTAATPKAYGYTNNGRVNAVNTTPYTWDAADNLTSTPAGDVLVYDEANQPVTRAVGGTTTSFTYNGNGNRTREAIGTTTSRTFAYDSDDRLTSHVKDGVTTAYRYDGDGTRGSKKVGTGVTERFAWDTSGQLPMLLADNTNMYLWGPGGMLLEQKPLAVGGSPAVAHEDALGTVHALTGPTGAVVGTSVYDTHGKRTGTTGTVTSPVGYVGEYRDAESDLIYLRARYYDPTTSQFLTRDPLVSATRDPYGYASGNPISLIDPLGLAGLNPLKWKKDDWFRVGTVLALTAGAVTLVALTGGAAAPAMITGAAYLGVSSSLATAVGTTMECTDGGPKLNCVNGIVNTALGAASFGIGSAANAALNTARHASRSSIRRLRADEFGANILGSFILGSSEAGKFAVNMMERPC